jgi:phage terminase small subunit
MPAKNNMRNADGWTDKERLFAHEYLIDKSKKEAAIRAGYSEKTAVKIGSEVYNRPHVKAWINERLAEKCQELDVTAERIIQELALIGFANLKGAYNPDGSFKHFPDMPEEVQRVISGMDVDELFEGHGEEREQVGFTKKVRQWDKLKALELLGKNLKMWTDKVEVSERPMVHIKDMTGRKNKAAQETE